MHNINENLLTFLIIWSIFGAFFFWLNLTGDNSHRWTIKQFLLATTISGPIAWAIGILIGAFVSFLWLWDRLGENK